jgi:hypothetical protein
MTTLPRALVGFSMTDIECYRRMQSWKIEEGINFDFCDSLAPGDMRPEEGIVKRKFLERIETVRFYIALIGTDTNFKDSSVRWEVEVALVKQRRIIAVNLDGWRRMNPQTCPAILQNVGATFVPYSPQIIEYALENARREVTGNWEFPDEIYTILDYTLSGNRAIRRTRRPE